MIVVGGPLSVDVLQHWLISTDDGQLTTDLTFLKNL
jgi:hypothetical protein